MPGTSTWATWEFLTSPFQGKGVTWSRSRTPAPRPSVKDRATTEGPRNPTILVVTLVLYPNVVTVTLYRHSTGGRVKYNIAAASYDSVGDNGVNQMYQCNGCDPIRANHDVSRSNLVVVLIVHEGWGERFSADPLFNRSDRKSETPWTEREVSIRRVNQFCTTELEGGSKRGFRLTVGIGRRLPPLDCSAAFERKWMPICSPEKHGCSIGASHRSTLHPWLVACDSGCSDGSLEEYRIPAWMDTMDLRTFRHCYLGYPAGSDRDPASKDFLGYGLPPYR